MPDPLSVPHAAETKASRSRSCAGCRSRRPSPRKPAGLTSCCAPNRVSGARPMHPVAGSHTHNLRASQQASLAVWAFRAELAGVPARNMPQTLDPASCARHPIGNTGSLALQLRCFVHSVPLATARNPCRALCTGHRKSGRGAGCRHERRDSGRRFPSLAPVREDARVIMGFHRALSPPHIASGWAQVPERSTPAVGISGSAGSRFGCATTGRRRHHFDGVGDSRLIPRDSSRATATPTPPLTLRSEVRAPDGPRKALPEVAPTLVGMTLSALWVAIG